MPFCKAWEEELKINIPQSVWGFIFLSSHKSSRASKTRDAIYKLAITWHYTLTAGDIISKR